MYEYEAYLLANYHPPSGSDTISPRTFEELTAILAKLGQHSAPSDLFSYVSYGASCLRAFVQLNLIGPPDKDTVDVEAPADLDEASAIERLSLGGEPAYVLCKSPSFLCVATRIFIDVGRNWRAVLPSASWWACRTCWIWQHLFPDRRPELRDTLDWTSLCCSQCDQRHVTTTQRLEPALRQQDILFDEFKFLDESVPDAPIPDDLKASYAIEKSRIYGFYYEPEKAEVALHQALALACLDNVHLTGILGRKTKFQLKAVAQLALEDLRSPETSAVAYESDDKSQAEFPVDCALNDDTLLNSTQFQTPLATKPFSPIQECALVAFLENVRRQHFSEDVLVSEIQKAYLERLLHHPVSYVCKFICLLRRCQLEMDNSRRIERALTQVEQLVKDFRTNRTSLPLRERLRCCFTVDTPPIWDVRKIEAGLLTKLGCTSEALRVFLDLQLWEEVVNCYQKLGMTERAEAVIKEQLEIKETPHLLCLMGDVRNEESWYIKAWELSGRRLARAQASLGMAYFVKKKYTEAVAAFELALAIFPLDLKSWYSLGYCAMQTQNYQRAAEAYRRCVTIDGDSFEAWNNLAACYVYLGDKYRAFQVLNEAIKCNYENWKVWENHIHMGVDTGHFREALTGINRIVDLKGKYDDTQVLEILVRVATNENQSVQGDNEIDENFVSDLRTLFGRLTTVVVNNAALWRLYADLRRPDETANLDDWERYVSILQKAHQTAVRSTGWEKDEEQVGKVVEYALRLAEAQLRLASLIEATSSSKDRPKQLAASARLMLRGILANISSIDCEKRDDHVCSLRGLLESIENV